MILHGRAPLGTPEGQVEKIYPSCEQGDHDMAVLHVHEQPHAYEHSLGDMHGGWARQGQSRQLVPHEHSL